MTIRALKPIDLAGTGASAQHARVLLPKLNELVTESNRAAAALLAVEAELAEFEGEVVGVTHPPVADLAALKALPEADLVDRMLVLAEAVGLYKYDAQSEAAADEPNVVVPTAVGADPGRFVKIADPAGVHTHVIEDLTDWPETFPPEAHQHAVEDISDWPETFPPAEHQHANADLTELAAYVAARVALPVADLAALKALTGDGLVDGALYHAKTLGFYRYDPAAADLANDADVVTPTSVGGGAGRFLRVAPAALAAYVAARLHAPKADLAALKATPLADLLDNALVLCRTLGLYRYDAASAAAGDDGDTVLPDNAPGGVGRFLRVAPAARAHTHANADLTELAAALAAKENTGVAAGLVGAHEGLYDHTTLPSTLLATAAVQDDTPTKVVGLAVAEDTAVMVAAEVSALRADDTTKAAGYLLTGAVRRAAAGNVTLVGSATQPFVAEDEAGLECALAVDTASQEVRVVATGLAPAESNDGGNQLSGWKVAGASAANTDAYTLYVKLTAAAVELYKDAGLDPADLVASGAHAQGTPETVALAAQNASGLTGEVVLDYSGTDSDIELAVAPYLFTARLRYTVTELSS